MAADIFSDQIRTTIATAQKAAIAGQPRSHPSPTDWRDSWIYFIMLDRFCNPAAPPKSTIAVPSVAWDGVYGYRQGGTFNGVRSQLAYLQQLGVGAIWLSPVLKNSRPDAWEYNYHGYGAQDFLNVDARFASDGTLATAEHELIALIKEAHERAIYVIVDIVLNHAARVFDYIYRGSVVDQVSDPALMAAPPGQEPPVEWLNGYGFPRVDWKNALPDPGQLSPDDAVWPIDLQRRVDFFRRRGSKLTDAPPPDGPIPGDFGTMRQLVVEYDAAVAGLEPLRNRYGRWPVLSILIQAYAYLIAKYDVDGFRIDSVKYLEPAMVVMFGNAIREFALTIGKNNFFTFGEIWDSEATISRFVGRNSTLIEGFGIDAALDFPLFFVLPGVAKALIGVEAVRNVLETRKRDEVGQVSSHGEAGRYFVSFLDNHDQDERFHHPLTPLNQVTLGLGALFTLQGIPCVYYGTEQGLTGAKDSSARPVLNCPESVREALWGRPDGGFDTSQPLYQVIQALAALRSSEPALRYGRIYPRAVSGNGQDFGLSSGRGGVLAYSRVVAGREAVVVANTDASRAFDGKVVVDLDIGRRQPSMTIAWSNQGTTGAPQIGIVSQARFHNPDGSVTSADTAALPVTLEPAEIQVITPL